MTKGGRKRRIRVNVTVTHPNSSDQASPSPLPPSPGRKKKDRPSLFMWGFWVALNLWYPQNCLERKLSVCYLWWFPTVFVNCALMDKHPYLYERVSMGWWFLHLTVKILAILLYSLRLISFVSVTTRNFTVNFSGPTVTICRFLCPTANFFAVLRLTLS